jgi:hypothetical protein
VGGVTTDLTTQTLDTADCRLTYDVHGPLPTTAGLPTEDDGVREDPLLSDLSWAVRSIAGDEFGYPGRPRAFTRTLREVLDASS